MKFKTRLYLDCRSNKPDATGQLMYTITKNGQRTLIPLNIFLKPEQWDPKLQAVVGSFKTMNVSIAQRKANLDMFLFNLETNGELAEMTAIEIKKLVVRTFLDRTPKEPKNLFMKRFKAFADSRKAQSTKNCYNYTYRLIERFSKGKADNLKFEDIDVKWLREFDDYLAETSTKNARNIHFRNIRAVFNEALTDEVITCYPFRKFKIRPEPTKKRSLSLANLRRVFDYDVEEYAVMYRDLFKLIFLLIGINSVDLHRLKEITPEGRIEYRRAKTNRQYSIKVEPEAMEIIEKYRGKKGLLCVADRWKDHVNFRHQMNTALQNMGTPVVSAHGKKDKEKKGEFPELSTYWARHTWATIAADLDIPDAVISQALGHTAENRVTDIYIQRNQRKVDEANRKVIDWVLYGKKA